MVMMIANEGPKAGEGLGGIGMVGLMGDLEVVEVGVDGEVGEAEEEEEVVVAEGSGGGTEILKRCLALRGLKIVLKDLCTLLRSLISLTRPCVTRMPTISATTATVLVKASSHQGL